MTRSADVDDASLDEWNLRGMTSPSPPPANSDVAIIEWTARLESIHGAIIKRLYSNVRLTGVAFMESVKELDSALNACKFSSIARPAHRAEN